MSIYRQLSSSKMFQMVSIDHRPVHSPEDPEVNDLAKGLMKIFRKAWHTGIVECNNPRVELKKMLQLHMGIPHPTTGRAPAELLLGRKFRTRLPQLPTPNKREDIK